MLSQILACSIAPKPPASKSPCFPELCLTGYTCNDLFHQDVLLRAARASLLELADKRGEIYRGLAIVGLPLLVDDQVFNCAAIFSRGQCSASCRRLICRITRSFTTPAISPRPRRLAAKQCDRWADDRCPVRHRSALRRDGRPGRRRRRRDLRRPVDADPAEQLIRRSPAPMCLLNLSASNEVIGKVGYRRELVSSQSGRCIAAYVYASCGVHESTTDLVFGGHCLIAENGSILAESPRFEREPSLLVARRRSRSTCGRSSADDDSFDESQPELGSQFRRIAFELDPVTARKPNAPHRRASVRAAGRARTARSAATRSSTSRSPGSPSGSNTSASPPVPSASPAGLIRRSPCSSPARRSTRSRRRGPRSRLHDARLRHDEPHARPTPSL